jgi:hypothetical protein
VALLYSARDSFSTIQVAWQYEYDNVATNLIMERWIRQQSPNSLAMLSSADKAQPVKSPSRFHRLVWWQKPTCWRDENYSNAQNKQITIVCEGRVSILNPHTQRWDSNPVTDEAATLEDRIDDIPLLDPSFLLTSHTLRPLANIVHAGRDAVQVQAVYRKGKSRIYEPMFWATADEYELLVDKERGVLLRYAAKLEGQEFAVATVNHLVFDEPIADTIFSTDWSGP